jgi:hypothetical protein
LNAETLPKFTAALLVPAPVNGSEPDTDANESVSDETS